MAGEKGVLVFAEAADGQVALVTREVLGVGRKLANDLGEEVIAVLVGQNVSNLAQDIIVYGADKVYVADDPLLAKYQTDSYVQVMEKACQEVNPNIVLIGVSSIGRDLSPRLAFRLDTGLAVECIDFKIDPGSKLLQMTRPVCGGNAMAVMVCETKRPQMASVKAKTQDPAEKDATRKGEVFTMSVSLDPSTLRVTVREVIKEEAEGIKLEDAPIVVSGGRGLGGPENFAILNELAGILGAAVGASKAVVDEKWVPPHMQVGLTGKTVSPNLYIAVGISGAAQHMAGCSYSKNIVAINKNPDAAIFRNAHYGVVGDYKNVMPGFMRKLKELLGK